MRIAVDARELRGKPTGVGRYLSEILAAWKVLPAAAASAALTASSALPLRPLAPSRSTARLEESVELASLPPAEQHRVLTARGLLGAAVAAAARPDVLPPWLRPETDAGPSFDALVAAAHAAGCRGVLIETPFGQPERCSPDHTAADISGAVDWILATVAAEVAGRSAA